jgi:peptide/nickel transport system substrate-binding protein
MITSAIPQEKPYPPIKLDVAKAKQLLADAGYPNGFAFTLTITNTGLYTADPQSVAVLIASQLQAVGISAKIQTIATQAEFTAASNAKPSKYQAWLSSSRPLVADSAYFWNLAFVTNATSNSFGYSNPTFDGMVVQALKTPFGADRLRLEQQALDLTQTDVPAIGLMDIGQPEAVRSTVKGDLLSNVHYTIFPQYLHY